MRDKKAVVCSAVLRQTYDSCHTKHTNRLWVIVQCVLCVDLYFVHVQVTNAAYTTMHIVALVAQFSYNYGF